MLVLVPAAHECAPQADDAHLSDMADPLAIAHSRPSEHGRTINMTGVTLPERCGLTSETRAEGAAASATDVVDEFARRCSTACSRSVPPRNASSQ